jgi:hypothetical protein
MTLYSEILNSAQTVFVTFLINSIDAIALLLRSRIACIRAEYEETTLELQTGEGERDHG